MKSKLPFIVIIGAIIVGASVNSCNSDPLIEAEKNCMMLPQAADACIAASTALIESQKDPADNKSFYDNRGMAYVSKGQYDKAIADFTEAIRLAPDFVLAYSNRGNAYNKIGQQNKAIADFDEFIRISTQPTSALVSNTRPSLPKAYYDRGIAKQINGDVEGGAADIAKAKELGYNHIMRDY